MFWRCLLGLALCFSAWVADGQNLDIALLREANLGRNTHLDHPFLLVRKTALPISYLGGAAAASYLYYWDRKEDALAQLAAPVASAALTWGLKAAVNRSRPIQTYADLQPQAAGTSPSFPSGHTSTAFAFATALSMAAPKWYVIAPAYTYAACVGYAGLHLGVHYPSDVLAGAAIGTLCAFASHKAVHYLYKKQAAKPNKPL